MKLKYDYSCDVENAIQYFSDKNKILYDSDTICNDMEPDHALQNLCLSEEGRELLVYWNLIAQARGDIIEYDKNGEYIIIHYHFKKFYSFLNGDDILKQTIQNTMRSCHYMDIKIQNNHVLIDLFLKIH